VQCKEEEEEEAGGRKEEVFLPLYPDDNSDWVYGRVKTCEVSPPGVGLL